MSNDTKREPRRRPGRGARLAWALAGAVAVAPIPGQPGSAQTAPGTAPQSARPLATAQPVTSERLPNVPGKTITLVRVTIPPGGSSPEHHHAGSVTAFILSGAVRSQITGGPAKVYTAGQSFFEPPGVVHMLSENASTTEPAELLAIFVADDGATLTIPGK
ncbi:cupin domain-containing protein [Limobrevibacterium gyesilva]|uniref:Cupin domain-containing protein n=1 Tax=Limobrevibacterium gyesilva TaxID=2991712 RepID=A0AA42CD81_9PROT|nr:cupin domain-containing protein [Limobrevibacterium gyesilva]MCW3474528.1 cupin domain-containing protein [Limobrevibacterium gyesilva]